MSVPNVFDALEFVVVWPASRHSEVQGEAEETCKELDCSMRRKAAKRKVMSRDAMTSVEGGW